MIAVLINKYLVRLGILIWFLHANYATIISQEVPVPLDIHFPLLLKVISFDRTLERNTNSHLNVGVLIQSKYKKSVILKNELLEFFSKSNINTFFNKKIELEFIDFTTTKSLENDLKRKKIDLMYITLLRGINISEICSVTKNLNIITMTGVPEYVNAGVSLGIDMKANKPAIFINLKSAIEEGAEFDSQLLKIAKVIN